MKSVLITIWMILAAAVMVYGFVSHSPWVAITGFLAAVVVAVLVVVLEQPKRDEEDRP